MKSLFLLLSIVISCGLEDFQSGKTSIKSLDELVESNEVALDRLRRLIRGQGMYMAAYTFDLGGECLSQTPVHTVKEPSFHGMLNSETFNHATNKATILSQKLSVDCFTSYTCNERKLTWHTKKIEPQLLSAVVYYDTLHREVARLQPVFDSVLNNKDEVIFPDSSKLIRFEDHPKTQYYYQINGPSNLNAKPDRYQNYPRKRLEMLCAGGKI